MGAKLLALFVGLLFAVGHNGLTFAADAADPVVGTWVLNLAKSKYSPGPAPKSLTRTYTESAQGLTMKISGVAADGSPISIQSTFKYDGKEYPYTGSPMFDSLSLKRVDGTTVKSVLKRGGKVVGSTTRTLSDGGKVLTLNTKSTDAQGVKHDEVAVFERQ
ncbi:MAG: hypothetical protein QOI59_743 [Gammaproteobacteria bacterium]|jgi:hypothetical protein|nr:hypothetical protein [Gammaproteobacteria bacterium]